MEKVYKIIFNDVLFSNESVEIEQADIQEIFVDNGQINIINTDGLCFATKHIEIV